jgi:hypothetical protein
MSTGRLLLVVAAAGWAAAGCTPEGALPAAPAKHGVKTVVAPGPDVYGWHAESETLYTYYGRQQLKLRCRGRFPATWKAPGDESWEVEAVNAQGNAVPFLGVVRRYLNMDGKEQVEGLPAFDATTLPAGLYIFIETAVKLAPDGSGPAEIRPNAFVMEIRKKGFMPYQARIALFPDQESPRTPRPEVGPPPHPAVDKESNVPKGAPLPVWF